MQDHLEKYPNFLSQTEKYVAEICFIIEGLVNRFCDFQKLRRVVEYLSFLFKSDLKIKETVAIICENYSLSKPSRENEILTL
jgi:hypothetical protein